MSLQRFSWRTTILASFPGSVQNPNVVVIWTWICVIVIDHFLADDLGSAAASAREFVVQRRFATFWTLFGPLHDYVWEFSCTKDWVPSSCQKVVVLILAAALNSEQPICKSSWCQGAAPSSLAMFFPWVVGTDSTLIVGGCIGCFWFYKVSLILRPICWFALRRLAEVWEEWGNVMSHNSAHTHTNMKIMGTVCPHRIQAGHDGMSPISIVCIITTSKCQKAPGGYLQQLWEDAPHSHPEEQVQSWGLEQPWTAFNMISSCFLIFPIFPYISCIAASEHVSACQCFVNAVRLFSSKEFSHIDFSKLYDVPPGQGLHTLARSCIQCHAESWRLRLLLPRTRSARSHTRAMAALFLCPC